MTILATHLSLILGAWRLHIRIEIDEPRDDPEPVGAASGVRLAEQAQTRRGG